MDIPAQNIKIKDLKFHSLLEYLFSSYDYKFLNNERQGITDPKEIERILRDNHDHVLAGHQGVVKTYDKIKKQYYWNNMKKKT